MGKLSHLNYLVTELPQFTKHTRSPSPEGEKPQKKKTIKRDVHSQRRNKDTGNCEPK